ncbi:hypothetical protein DFH08DRAFT_932782 [Mycena albidolilacea]|uniref:Uncharacterized protein n=1 Tax=Mycena albidolilacea TaxID=1033008 RepID=A0AAD7EWY2_9AGAR|nr:hypothetical protein DFH08DRAFT_932782 [Mycena albidolilacea]
MIHFPRGATRVHLPTLNFLHISIAKKEPAEYLIEIFDIFDAPALTKLVVHGTHGDQISLLLCSTGLPHSSFPALTTVSFIYTGSCHCEIEGGNRPSLVISSPPIVFPALSHLSLINQCYTEHLIRDILGPESEPWPLLKIITLGVKNDSFEDVRGALETTVISKRERGDPLPKVQILRAPTSLANWNEKNSWDMETAW